MRPWLPVAEAVSRNLPRVDEAAARRVQLALNRQLRKPRLRGMVNRLLVMENQLQAMEKKKQRRPPQVMAALPRDTENNFYRASGIYC